MIVVAAVDDGFLSTRRLDVILYGTPVILYSDHAHYYVPKRFHIPRSDQLSITNRHNSHLHFGYVS